MPAKSKCGFAAASSYLFNITMPPLDATCNDAPVPFTAPPPSPPSPNATTSATALYTTEAQSRVTLSIAALHRYQHLLE